MKMANTVGVFLFIVGVTVHAQYPALKQYESCYTPEETPGQCISIRNCVEIVRVLKRRPITRDTAAYLRRAHCGFEGLDAKVCCSLNENDRISISDPYPPISRIDTSLLPGKHDCGQSSSDKIVGGLPADLFDFPWMALINYRTPEGEDYFCGGSLISKRYVLTAAHCLKGRGLPKNSEIVSVRLGEYNLESERDCVKKKKFQECSDPPVDVPVVERIPHEYYNAFDDNQYNDIALLRLSEDVTFTDFVKPICLPIYPEIIIQTFAGTNATVSGWGKTADNNDGSSIKLKVNLPVKSHQECKQVYDGTKVSVSKMQLCAGGINGKDSCRGDSGGPLMNLYTAPGEINWYLSGIVSFGPAKCGLEGWPGIYTRVTEYIPWILKHMRP